MGEREDVGLEESERVPGGVLGLRGSTCLQGWGSGCQD